MPAALRGNIPLPTLQGTVCCCHDCHSPFILWSGCYSPSHLGSLRVATAGWLWVVEQRCLTLKEALLDLCHRHTEWFRPESGISCENKDWHERCGLNLEDCRFHAALISGCFEALLRWYFPASPVQWCFFVRWGWSGSNIWSRESGTIDLLLWCDKWAWLFLSNWALIEAIEQFSLFELFLYIATVAVNMVFRCFGARIPNK